jgi:tetratricopeptide (TPR) repeat protein
VAGTVTAGLLAGACFLTGVLPVFNSQSALGLARSLAASGSWAAAQQALQEAVVQDPLALQPRVDLANLETRLAEAGGPSGKAEERWKQVLAMHPRMSFAWKMLALTLGREATADADNEVDAAVSAARRAVELDPTNARLRAEVAFLAERLRRERFAAEQAAAALAQDALNRELGHADQFLNADQRTRLQELVDRSN